MYSGYMSSEPSRSAGLMTSVVPTDGLQLDGDALGVERLLVELAEDLGLREVLRPDAHRAGLGDAVVVGPVVVAAARRERERDDDGEAAPASAARRTRSTRLAAACGRVRGAAAASLGQLRRPAA